MDLHRYVRDVPDFPIPGVMFRDISELLSNREAFKTAVENMSEIIGRDQIDYIVGIESRGFILGAAIAAFTGKGFIPLRKAGKLPPPVESHSYTLEYGQATLEVARGQGRVAIIDDVLATGGTLEAARALCVRAGFQVKSIAVLINLKFLNEYRFGGEEIPSLLTY